MKTTTAALLTSASCLLALALSVASPVRAADMPTEGSKAPDFTLKSQDGTAINLKDYHGKWVVLYFYPKDMTKGCTIEAHNFQRDLAQFQAKNTVIVGVSVDTVDSHQEFCTKESLTFRLLADPTHEVTAQYGSVGDFKGMTLANRNTFLIDPSGVIRKVWVKVNPEAHSGELLTALSDLQKSGGSN